ncbi:DUF1826 domain-containing protein [Sinorhizobium garamanticum]|uniref:DUF1826 domain-containing protein n=1 Tax=Sinorhizobium garamanticum TaxID=680247 RepID=A0ABY8D8B9_9HYPH|nr:DUF1826 domain-containing protein [Sinorhizobium garamanticum]WEX85750.1 DUF1826 domain-containing protein [Sinorhizobium garamanticum]
MRPDPAIAPPPPRRRCPTAKRLARDILLNNPVSVLQRTLSADVSSALERAPVDQLPDFRFTASAVELRSTLLRHFNEMSLEPAWLRDWLFNDVFFLARLFRYLTSASSVIVRLETITTDACKRFHADNVRLRLVSTYRGPGTQWLGPRALAMQEAGKPLSPDAIKTTPTGAILLIRGSKSASETSSALLHRSPPIEGTGINRLLLAVDDADEFGS